MNKDGPQNDEFQDPIDNEAYFAQNQLAMAPTNDYLLKLNTITQQEIPIYKSQSPSKPKKEEGPYSNPSDYIKYIHSNESGKNPIITLSPKTHTIQTIILPKKKLVLHRQYAQVELEKKSYSEFKYTFKFDEFTSPKCEICIAKMNTITGSVAIGCKNGSMYIYIVKDETDGRFIIR